MICVINNKFYRKRLEISTVCRNARYPSDENEICSKRTAPYYIIFVQAYTHLLCINWNTCSGKVRIFKSSAIERLKISTLNVNGIVLKKWEKSIWKPLEKPFPMNLNEKRYKATSAKLTWKKFKLKIGLWGFVAVRIFYFLSIAFINILVKVVFSKM